MIWKLLFGYVICSQLIVTIWTWVSLNSEDCEGQIATKEGELGLKFGVKAFLVMMAIAPFLLPYMIYLLACCIQKSIAEFKELSGTFRPVLLDPLHEANVPDELAQSIREQAPAAIAADFESLGDFWLKKEPINSKARIFWNGDTFAEVGFALDTLYCEITSYLEDGTMIASANCNPIALFTQAEKYGCYVNAIPNIDMAELLESHQKFVEKIGAKIGCSIQSIPRKGWEPFYRYNNQKFGMAKFQLGKFKEPPKIDLKFPIQNEPRLCSSVASCLTDGEALFETSPLPR